jgi:hypothetical protein
MAINFIFLMYWLLKHGWLGGRKMHKKQNYVMCGTKATEIVVIIIVKKSSSAADNCVGREAVCSTREEFGTFYTM